MKKSLAAFLLIILLIIVAHTACAQRKCGITYARAALIAADKNWEGRIEAQRVALQGVANGYKAKRMLEKGTSTAAIPVIFHVLVTYDQYISLGGNPGIAQRVDSQIAVLNRDFNALNSDSDQIPAGWKHLFAATGIHFGLAHTDPLGFGSTGYEIRIIPDSLGGFSGAPSNYHNAKNNSTGGFDSWDVTRYINVWCFNPTDVPGLLGATVSKSNTGGTGFPPGEQGICLYYQALGKRAAATDNYVATTYMSDYYDQGRTLTHEMGHFFEIWHTWGDDNGYCPWTGPHRDDGLADTPPEGDAKYFNYPNTIAGGTYYDTCRYYGSPATDTQAVRYGVATLSFMNYTDDVAMHMFTTDQAAAMAAMVAPGGENYSLTQNPELLDYSPRTGVDEVTAALHLQVSPNPSDGHVNITFSAGTEQLISIAIITVLGQQVYAIAPGPSAQDYYSIDLSAMNKGIYMVRCNFAKGTITRKIVIQ